TDYYFTQFLTGHGSFGSYLEKIGKAENSECIMCGEAGSDPEHAIFQCVAVAADRLKVSLEVGETLSADSCVDQMLESEAA
ncbi:MAG: hypothetical protein LN546_04580, partial [Rickettsia endosymbiont of Ecitomorpha arachnoides]|nr:hypothetical protein [Rickettsia endosymbiont of Ecitomorpha arachnoides]